MRIALAAMVVSAALGACAAGEPSGAAPPGSRVSGSCVIGGCSDELCADQLVASPCIWHADFVCFWEADCGRQPSGACGWIATPELTDCLATHPH